MRDIDEGDAQLLLQALELDLHLTAQLEVERAERLIEQQQLRLEREGAGDGDALALAAGELAGHAPRVLAHLHELKHLAHALVDGAFIHAAQAQAVGDVLFDVHMGKERVALEDGIHRPLFGRQVGHVPPAEEHAALVGRFEAGDDAQRGRLAAAGRAQQRDEFAAVHVERYIREHLALAEILLDMLKGKEYFLHSCLPAFAVWDGQGMPVPVEQDIIPTKLV